MHVRHQYNHLGQRKGVLNDANFSSNSTDPYDSKCRRSMQQYRSVDGVSYRFTVTCFVNHPSSLVMRGTDWDVGFAFGTHQDATFRAHFRS